MNKQTDKCAFDKCDSEAKFYLGDNLNLKGNIPMCPSCFAKFQEHTEAREKSFKEDGRIEAIKDEINWLEHKRDAINGIDIMDVDGRLAKLKEELT